VVSEEGNRKRIRERTILTHERSGVVPPVPRLSRFAVGETRLTFNRSDAVTFDGVISGTGSVAQSGTGTTILTADSTYTGGTTINAGRLQLGNGGTTGSIVGSVIDNGILAFNRSNTATFGGTISGTGSVIKDGTGALILTANSI